MSDYDADMDGEDSDQYGGTDCDDTDANANELDNDLDGFSTCDGDCDDSSDVTYLVRPSTIPPQSVLPTQMVTAMVLLRAVVLNLNLWIPAPIGTTRP